MSLILIFHNQDFAIVGCDGRVSRHEDDALRRLAGLPQRTEKRKVTVPGLVHRKFAVLRPGLVLAGSSSFGTVWDWHVYEAARRYVEVFPDAKLDEVAAALEPAAREMAYALQVPEGEGLRLNLVGHDQGRMRVRVFEFGPTTTEEAAEGDTGVTLGSVVESEVDILPFLNELMERAQIDPTAEGIQKRMLQIMEAISERWPVTIGPPYFFHVIKSPSSLRTT